MRNSYTNTPPIGSEYGPPPASRVDSIRQGFKIGELFMTAREDRIHGSFDHQNWGTVRLVGAMFLREGMTRMDALLRQSTEKVHCILLAPTYEAWCAIRDVLCPTGERVSEMQRRYFNLANEREHFTAKRTGPYCSIQRLSGCDKPMILLVWAPGQGLTINLYPLHGLSIPEELCNLDPSHPKMLAFAESLRSHVYPW